MKSGIFEDDKTSIERESLQNRMPEDNNKNSLEVRDGFSNTSLPAPPITAPPTPVTPQSLRQPLAAYTPPTRLPFPHESSLMSMVSPLKRSPESSLLLASPLKRSPESLLLLTGPLKRSPGSVSRFDKEYSRYFVQTAEYSRSTLCLSDLDIELSDLRQLHPDDYLSDEEPEPPKLPWWSWRRWSALTRFLGAAVAVLVAILGVLAIFAVISAHDLLKRPPPEVHDMLSPYRYPTLAAIRTLLVDPDTPKEALHRTSLVTGESWHLVFSDEFNANGRTFFEGDDQFFTAPDFHYAATKNLEYYIPEMATTANGSLRITLDEYPTNGLKFRLLMLQLWNQLCFNKRAMVEISMRMPARALARGYWPAVWSLGNLARPGFGASTDGVWPYTYDTCDYGITANQLSPDGISFLPGQRLSKCTCLGEDHPGLGVGRGAPEIDLIEGTHDVSAPWALGAQTVQVAPFDPWWRPDYDYLVVPGHHTYLNPHTGSMTQEAIAALTVLDPEWYELPQNASKFQRYGFEYNSDNSANDLYILFYVGNSTTMTLYGDALHPEGTVGWRPVSREPMSLVFNLAMSPQWMDIDFLLLEFPATLEVDYIRVYQPHGLEEMTCEPDDYPTQEYINRHKNAYMDANLTSWAQAGYDWPRNSFVHGCPLKHNL